MITLFTIQIQHIYILLKATGKIADGNLNVTIDEDPGLFNPFKKEIKSIQEGFKNAVEGEVKSQSMKTELIEDLFEVIISFEKK